MLAWRRYDAKYAAVIRDIYALIKGYEPGFLRAFPSSERT